MSTNHFTFKSVLKAAILVAAILLLGADASFAQQTVNLTAAPTIYTAPDGTVIPMWGYFCGLGVTGSTANCAALNPGSAATLTTPATWSPVVITVPTGQALTVNLTNNLLFVHNGSTTPNTVPTSIVIVGQVGGGLGTSRTSTPSPNHTDAQGCPTWFIASGATPPGVPCPGPQAGASNLPPLQGPRVQSMATEAAAGTTVTLTWPALKPGTYLLESGTHPSIQVPMGLIGMLVVTTAPTTTSTTSGGTTTLAAGTAYPAVGTAPAVTYNAEVPMEFSEIDPVQNKAVDSAVRTPGFNEMNMKSFGDAITSITVTNGGSGYASNPAVTIGAPTGAAAGGSAATATAQVGKVITGIALPSTGSGSGYTAAPAVTITDTGTPITTATATAVMTVGAITAPATTGTGSNYVVGDHVQFTGGGAGASGTVASLTATGAILTVNVANGGSDYTSAPTAVVGGAGAALTPVLSTTTAGTVGSVTVTSAGSGYVVGDIVTFTGTSTTAAAATVGTVSPLGAILTVTITNPGAGYTAAPTATVGGTGAALTTTLAVTGITVTSGGSGYTAPTATIPSPVTGGAAIALTVSTAGTNGSVYSVTVTNGGSKYGTTPSVTIAAGTTTATATANLSQACDLAGSVNQFLASGAAAGCYPSAVNYTPFYYLINGLAFNKTNPSASLFAATAGVGTTGLPVTTGITGTVLVRLVNAGLRMHTPSIVNSLTQGFSGAGAPATVAGFTLVAEDGNPVPGVQAPGANTAPAAPRVQTDVLMVPGKVFDVLVNVPASVTTTSGTTTTTTTPALPVYARDLALSGNSSVRDAGMLAYIGVNGAGLPAPSGAGVTSGVFAAAKANADTYNSLVAGQTFTVSDPSKGVMANDVNVYGVTLLTAPANGTITCTLLGSVPGMCANGTFTYTPNAGSTATSDTFFYCANNGLNTSTTPPSCPVNLTAKVSLGASTLTSTLTAAPLSYTSNMATFLKVPSPGLLIGGTDSNNLPLTVVTSATTGLMGGTLTVDPNGGFSASVPAAGLYTFSYQLQNSLGTLSNTATVTLTFPAPSNLQVKVLDAQLLNNCNGNSACISGLTPLTDYRWIIEEDQTFWVDPNCTTNSSITTAGCPSVVGPAGTQSTIPTFGTQFHTSAMNFIAQGCTGPLSCEYGQTMLDNRATIPNTTPGGAPVANPNFGMHVNAVCDLGNGACRPDPGNGTTSGGFTWVNPSQVHLDPSKRYYISVLPGDAANPFPAYLGQPTCGAGPGTTGYVAGQCGHTMSGAPIPPACNLLGGSGACPTTAGTAPVAPPAFAPVTVLVLPTPLPTGKLSVIVFQDDFPLNGEQDGGGGNGTIAPIEPGLGGFNLVLWDTYGGLGDVTGQDTYDMFNQPLSNSLAGTIDPVSGLDACPVSAQTPVPVNGGAGPGAVPTGGVTGMIVTCPKYESDGKTLSPLAGQAVIDHLMPEKFSVQAYPGADRIARGEQWVQTNTLDGQHPHDSFIRIGEPSYFQEYGPAGYHVAIGFANPAIINARHNDVCQGLGTPGSVGPCNNIVQGEVDVQRLSRTPDQRLYPSGSRDALAWTQCWVSLGDPDGEDFMFTFCDASGQFKFTNVPGGNWRITVGDQWNDQIIDGLSLPANVGCTSNAPNGTINATTCPGGQTLDMGHVGSQQWQANLYTTTFIDDNKNGIKDPGEIGIPFIYTMIHYRDGHTANNLVTDFNGVANFNETYPLFNWYVVEADTGRYKTTGIHTVYDAGGPADGSPDCGTTTSGARPCGTSTAYKYLANTYEAVPLPADLSVPGAVYCATADCMTEAAKFAAGTAVPSSSTASTGRIDPPWVWGEGWSGLTAQSNWIEFGKAPYAACNAALPVGSTNFCATVTATAPGSTTPTTTLVGENGGIHGLVVYASTRPFDDASQMIQQPWEPNIPRVTVNLYKEGFAADGVTPTLTLVDTTQSTSWDDWAQGFYPSSTAGTTATSVGLKPYMSCPGQGTATAGSPNQDLFFFTLYDQPNYLDWYNSVHNGGTLHTLPYNSQYKCYDAMHIWNQVQPAPYDGRYFFPSSLGWDPQTGKLLAVNGSTNGVTSSMTGTNCTICVANPDSTDKYRVGTPMLPPGKYVVQVMLPPGYEVYKEEDKNLLIGDNYIAPVTQEFAGLGADIFIMPDQASVASLYDPTGSGYNPTNFQDQTTGLGLSEELSGVPGFPGFQDPLWPCVGEMRTVPDYLSLFPQAKEVAPFAGATRPLCDRKEVALPDQMSVSVKFFIYTSTHIASKYTGVITDDMTSEFDPFAPQFGEKFSPPNQPVSTRDYLGNEISRVYSDHWGVYDGLTFSSWEVNPPNITGYSPTIMVQCMNDPGPILDTRLTIVNTAGATVPNPTYGQMITDPLYNPAYSNFCYEQPYMPGLTLYADTPVVPTQAFVGAAYNAPDCNYPDTTPAIKEVDGDQIGPWVSAAGKTLTITALGDQQVANSAFSGPSASVAPFNLKTVTHHYGFGTRCLGPTPGNTTCNTLSSVTIGGVSAVVNSWSDTQIHVTVPTGVPNCVIQQQAQYGGKSAQCGQLVITAGNGKQSVDTVTVTIGGKAPTHVSASQSVQSAIDAAFPGDLLIIDPNCATVATMGTPSTAATCSAAAVNATTPTQTASIAAHQELLIMWKPVRLQGVGPNSVINANTNPAGKLLDPWRRHLNCFFGLTLQGVPYTAATGSAPYDPNNIYSCPDTSNPSDVWNFFTAQPNAPQIDRLPLEAILGWDATQNGNLAEQLQEPSLMGAYEGAGITVLGKGVDYHGSSPWTDGNEGGAFPTNTTLLTGVGPDPTALPVGDVNSFCHTLPSSGTSSTSNTPILSDTNPFPSNFVCNPSSIDGLSVINSSQGGGGIFVHGWAHHLQIANNRVYNNAGTLTGGISVGQGEFPTAVVMGSTTNSAPGSCSDGTGFVTNQHLPYCLQLQVNVHNNFITNNSSLGDELFSATLAGGGGATFCTGNDYYKFNYNWVCGNVSAGEGGALVHLGEIQNGDIEHNSLVLNQSDNPTIPTNGGAIEVMGTPDTDPSCGTQIDQDCPPGLSDGTGHNLVINGNLIQANMAESGSGGGIRLQQVNGTEVSTFPGIYPITAATEAPIVTITLPSGATAVPKVGDTVTISAVSTAGVTTALPTGYTGTFTVIHVGTTGGEESRPTFQYIGTTSGLAAFTTNALFPTFTDAAVLAGAAQNFTSANETAAGDVTITSTLSPTVGDRVTITGVTPTGYNGAYTVTSVPSTGTFTYTDTNTGLAPFTAPATNNPATVTDVAAAANPSQSVSNLWNSVSITNNMIVNNIAGWDGGGISLQDSLNVSIINNTIASNDTLASSGVLTQSIGTPQSSGPPGSCLQGGLTTSCPQPAGVSSTLNSSLLTTTFTGLTITCPTGSPNCTTFSNPVLQNNIIWRNHAYYIGVGNQGQGTQNQQKLVSLFTMSGAPAPTQTVAGACAAGLSYWDLGVRNDTGPGNHSSGVQLNPMYSVLDDTGYDPSNVTTNPNIVSQYCNGSRVPPECTLADGCGGPNGYGVPPGIADATSPNPIFSLTPSATVDEGNNWINVSWGPLDLTNPSLKSGTGSTGTGNWGSGPLLAKYALAAGSPAIDYVPLNSTTLPTATIPALTTDFYGNPRPDRANPNHFDVGAVEFQGGSGVGTIASISPNTGVQGTTVNVTITGTGLSGATAVNVSGSGVTADNVTATSDTTVTATFTITATASLSARNVSVATPNGTTNTVTFTVTSAVLGATVGFSGPTPALATNPANTTTKTGTITVSNNATGTNAGPLTLTAEPTVAEVGTTGGTFSIVAGGTCTSGTVVNPGSSCTINVQYAPGGSTALTRAHVTLTDIGAATATQSSANFPAN